MSVVPRRPTPMLVALTYLLSASGVFAQAPGSPRDEIVAEIARLDSIWLTAYVTADVEAVRPILAADFEGQIYDTVMGRAELLARVERSTNVASTELESLVINVYDDLAVIHARRRNELRVADPQTTERFVYTDVYVWRDGRWQCITGQSAPIADDG